MTDSDEQSTGSHARSAPRVPCSLSLAKPSLALLLALALFGCGPRDECHLGAQRCDGNVALRCDTIEDGQGGHSYWSRHDCGAGFCRDTGNNSFCSLEREPDPKCVFDATHVYSGYCEGEVAVNCDGGYVTEREDCASKPIEPASPRNQCIEQEAKNSATCESVAL